MKAVVQRGYGGPEVLAVREVGGPPVAGKGEVLIRVRSARVNPADCFRMRGLPGVARLFFGLRAPRDRVRGIEVAGTVTAVGAGVTGLHPGDDVFGWCGRRYHGGGLAEYACLPAQLVRAKRLAGSTVRLI